VEDEKPGGDEKEKLIAQDNELLVTD